jgi:hypothetical protein
MATTILRRTDIDPFRVGYLASKIAVTLPSAGFALVRAALDRALRLTASRQPRPRSTPFPENAPIEKQIEWLKKRPSRKEYRELIEHQTNYYDLPEMAKVAPGPFMQELWPWYLEILEALAETPRSVSETRYVRDESLFFNISHSFGENPPLVKAIFDAVESLSTTAPATFRAWLTENQSVDLLTVQKLIGRGFLANIGAYAADAARFLLSDKRRLMLGNSDDRFSLTKSLIAAIIPKLSNEEVRKLEEAVLAFEAYPRVPNANPAERRIRLKSIRAARLRLLRAFPPDRLSPQSARLVREEERALQSPSDWDARMEAAGVVGSPMSASAMRKARDEEILKILDEVDDATDWDHPKDWMRGGNIQLSREFAEFTKAEPARAVQIIRLLKPGRHERAAAYAIQAISALSYDSLSFDLPAPIELTIDLIRELDKKGFEKEEYRQAISNSITQIVRRKAEIPDDLVAILERWLTVSPRRTPGVAGGGRAKRTSSRGSKISLRRTRNRKNEEHPSRSILWDDKIVTLPHGNYPTLEALAHVFLAKRPPDVERWLSIMENHLAQKEDLHVWTAVLRFLPHLASGNRKAAAKFLAKLFDRFPQVLFSDEAITLIAHVQSWIGDEYLRTWLEKLGKSRQPRSLQGYGELIGLLSVTRRDYRWINDVVQKWLSTAAEGEIRAGIAYAAAHLWSEKNHRERAAQLLTGLIPNADAKTAKGIFAAFLSVDRLTPDGATVALLEALVEHPTAVGLAGDHFLVERLQTLLPHQADLVGRLAVIIVDQWSLALGDIRTSVAAIAPELVNLALTLHRLGGAARLSGLKLFERLLDIGAYGAREALGEIDNRLSSPSGLASAPRRITRRRTSVQQLSTSH